jgi:hypothetical protein
VHTPRETKLSSSDFEETAPATSTTITVLYSISVPVFERVVPVIENL